MVVYKRVSALTKILLNLLPTKNRKVKANNWHSWDAKPWEHPWLSSKNLREMKQFSDVVLEVIKKRVEHVNYKELNFGFVGNLANNLYTRMVPLAKYGYKLKLFTLNQDKYIMSQPEWEEYDGCLYHSETDFERLKELGYDFPGLSLIDKGEIEGGLNPGKYKDTRFSLMPKKVVRKISQFNSYAPSMSTLIDLRKMDVLWGIQRPHYCYMSGKPYVVSQTGGDIWFECSRGDTLGDIQRESFKAANLFLASNPWSYAHARRFNLTNLIQLPMIIDETIYSPGYGKFREEWEKKTGGDFFVFSTSRLDKQFKNNEIALKGFETFCKKYPSARLILMRWGNDLEQADSCLMNSCIQEKILWLPVSGKARLREYYRSVDCFFDQFVLGYYGAAGLEAMASGLPTIARYEIEQYNALCATGAPPVLQSETAEDVFKHLERLYQNKEYKLKHKQVTRKWFMENHSAYKWKNEHLAVLAATAKNYKVDFSSSPLNAPLTEEEKEYHHIQMNKAPIFPNYTVG